MIEPDENLPLSDAEKRLLDKTPDADREARLAFLQQQLLDIPVSANDELHNPNGGSIALKRALTELEIAGLLLDLDNKQEAWTAARGCIDVFINHEAFEDAAMACQYVYLSDQSDAITAIGQAAWLAVTYPVDPHLSANILSHIIDETPDDSDGAAVAAATAHYVVDIRATDAQREELRLFTGANLARVGKRHANVKSQTEFELWVERLELDVPEKFLVRLRNVIDVMVQTDWWFDRETLQSKLPD